MYAIDTDGAGNVYVAGWLSSAAANFLQSSYVGGYDYFVAKYDGQDGSLIWGDRGVTTEYDEYIALVQSGGYVFAGGMTEGIAYGPESYGVVDVMLGKYDAISGALQYGRQNGSNDADEIHGLATDDSYDIFATGVTYGSWFSTNQGGGDVFICKFEATSGDLLWGVQYGKSLDEEGVDLILDSNDNIWVFGETDSEWFSAGGYFENSNDNFMLKVSGFDGSFIAGIQDEVSSSQDDTPFAIDILSSDLPVVSGSSWGGIQVGSTSLYIGGKNAFYLVLGCGDGTEEDDDGCIYNPTMAPTFNPTYQPSYTTSPSFKPTFSPSQYIAPTSNPSYQPTDSPTLSPTMEETNNPNSGDDGFIQDDTVLYGAIGGGGILVASLVGFLFFKAQK